jgi:hypothetical protein
MHLADAKEILTLLIGVADKVHNVLDGSRLIQEFVDTKQAMLSLVQSWESQSAPHDTAQNSNEYLIAQKMRAAAQRMLVLLEHMERKENINLVVSQSYLTTFLNVQKSSVQGIQRIVAKWDADEESFAAEHAQPYIDDFRKAMTIDPILAAREVFHNDQDFVSVYAHVLRKCLNHCGVHCFGIKKDKLIIAIHDLLEEDKTFALASASGIDPGMKMTVSNAPFLSNFGLVPITVALGWRALGVLLGVQCHTFDDVVAAMAKQKKGVIVIETHIKNPIKYNTMSFLKQRAPRADIGITPEFANVFKTIEYISPPPESGAPTQSKRSRSPSNANKKKKRSQGSSSGGASAKVRPSWSFLIREYNSKHSQCLVLQSMGYDHAKILSTDNNRFVLTEALKQLRAYSNQVPRAHFYNEATLGSAVSQFFLGAPYEERDNLDAVPVDPKYLRNSIFLSIMECFRGKKKKLASSPSRADLIKLMTDEDYIEIVRDQLHKEYIEYTYKYHSAEAPAPASEAYSTFLNHMRVLTMMFTKDIYEAAKSSDTSDLEKAFESLLAAVLEKYISNSSNFYKFVDVKYRYFSLK